jgi:Icc protein
MWIAQISDPHVQPAGVLYNGVVNTGDALTAAVRQVNLLDPLPDVVLLTGDVVEEATPGAYAAARKILDGLRPPLVAIPGNHDTREGFRAAFGDGVALPLDGPLHFVDKMAGEVRIVALDVTVPGQHHGEVDDPGLEWLERTLATEPVRPTVIMMHQPPLICGVPYLDAYNCRAAGRLAEVVRRYSNVERVLCGHAHRHMQARFGGTLLCTAPSTATAIALRAYPDAIPASYLEPPGFLHHHWHHGLMVTHQIHIGTFPGPYAFA